MTDSIHSDNIHSRLRHVWRRGQLLHSLAGLFQFVRWGILLLVLAVAIDAIVHLPSFVRAFAMVFCIGVPLVMAWKKGWCRCRSFDPVGTALQVEDHFGGLESIVVSSVQFRNGAGAPGVSPALCSLTCQRAEGIVAPLKTADAVRFDSLHRPVVIALLCAGVLGAAAIVNGPFLLAGLGRIFTPWLEISYPTRTRIELAQGDITVKEGDGVQIQARLLDEVPGNARLALRTGQGSPRVHNLAIVDGSCEYRIAATFRSFTYRISAGDAETPWHTVNVITAPRATKARTILTFPEYTARKPETIEALTITVPEGTDIQWQLTLDRPVRKGSFIIEGSEPIPVAISPDGRHVSVSHRASSSQAYHFQWSCRDYDYAFESPRNYLQVSPDRPPRIQLTSPAEDMYATLGRKLDVAFTARDDHGIADSNIFFRVNNAPERKTPLSPNVDGEETTYRANWDYAKIIKGLDIGDSIVLGVEVADRYPGPDGPHRARSEMRRVTFLSREGYLEHVMKQKHRLLSQLRTIYRQERAAYEVVTALDPAELSFAQTCLLEGVRQDLMAERLGLVTQRIGSLIEDLAANNITDASYATELTGLRMHLSEISGKHITSAAGLLRGLAEIEVGKTYDTAPAARAIEVSARELASLVLRLGINYATEVFSRELKATTGSQTLLRLQTMDAQAEADSEQLAALSARQSDLAGWMSRLLPELMKDPDYTKSALAVVRLSRVVKNLESSDATGKMAQAASLLKSNKLDEASGVQAEVLAMLSEAEYGILPGAEVAALLKARDLIRSLMNQQKELRLLSSRIAPGDIAGRQPEMIRWQKALCGRLRPLVIPPIPAPRPQLLDPEPAAAPPVQQMNGAVRDAMQNAHDSLVKGNLDEARKQQSASEASMAQLLAVLQTRTSELIQFGRIFGMLGAADDRVVTLKDFETRTVSLLEKTEDAEFDETSAVYLADQAQILADEISAYGVRIKERNDASANPSNYLVSILRPMETASAALTEAAGLLKKNKAVDAIPLEEKALQGLKAAGSIAGHEANILAQVVMMLDATAGAGVPGEYLGEIVAEQRAVSEATAKASRESAPLLAPAQQNLCKALEETATTLAPGMSTMDMEQMVGFAQSELGASAVSLSEGNTAQAQSHQKEAGELVAEMRTELDRIATQNGYLVEILDFFQKMSSEGEGIIAMHSPLCEEFRKTEDSSPAYLKKIADRQRQLKDKADEFGRLLCAGTGQGHFKSTSRYLDRAIKELDAGNRTEALVYMDRATGALNADCNELVSLMTRLAYIPNILPLEASEEVLTLLGGLKTAAGLRKLCREMRLASPDQKAKLTPQHLKLAEECKTLLEQTHKHAVVQTAVEKMREASAHLAKASWSQAYRSQREAGNSLRRFVLEYTLSYVDVPGGKAMKRKKPASKFSKGLPPLRTMLELQLIAKVAVDGELPEDKRTEWEVLGRRDRAALNENFARELPLEYRDLLKDYYERLAE